MPMRVFRPFSRSMGELESDKTLAQAFRASFDLAIRTQGADGFSPEFAGMVDWRAMAAQELARRMLQQLPDRLLHALREMPVGQIDRVIAQAGAGPPFAAPSPLMPGIEINVRCLYGAEAVGALVQALDPHRELLSRDEGAPVLALICEILQLEGEKGDTSWPAWSDELKEVFDAGEALLLAFPQPVPGPVATSFMVERSKGMLSLQRTRGAQM